MYFTFITSVVFPWLGPCLNKFVPHYLMPPALGEQWLKYSLIMTKNNSSIIFSFFLYHKKYFFKQNLILCQWLWFRGKTLFIILILPLALGEKSLSNCCHTFNKKNRQIPYSLIVFQLFISF